jgi:hypothetical protein
MKTTYEIFVAPPEVMRHVDTEVEGIYSAMNFNI